MQPRGSALSRQLPLHPVGFLIPPVAAVEGEQLLVAPHGIEAGRVVQLAEANRAQVLRPRIGFDEVNVHHVGQEQRPFIETFGRDVLPQLR